MINKPFKIFYSYSHKDEIFRDQLETHLSILKRNNIIDSWHDRKVVPGSNWENKIDEELNGSEMILLLISSDFIASEYCYGSELQQALALHETGKATVIPIFIRPVEWEGSPFAILQGLPKDAKPITSWANQDEAWLDVVKGIKNTISKQKNARKRISEGDGLIDLKEVIKKEFDRIAQIFENQSMYGGFATGYTDLDKTIDGIHQYDLILIGGRSGMGKTDFALNIGANIGLNSKNPVAYFSLKHPAEVITRKLMSYISTISSHNLIRGHIKNNEWPLLTRAIGMSSELPLYIDDRPNICLRQIEDEIKKINQRNKIELVIIDNLHNLKVNESLSYQEISQKLIIIGRQYKVPIICLTPVSTVLENRMDKRPIISDLSDWRCLGEDANVILFLYRNEVYYKSEDNPTRGTIEVIVNKNAYGPLGTITLAYNENKSSYHNLEHFKE